LRAARNGKTVSLLPQLLTGFFILKIMITKLEELKKKELIEIVKKLFIEKKLNQINNSFPDNDFKKFELMEVLILDAALDLDIIILSYFGYDETGRL
jgi:hypothetical protein